MEIWKPIPSLENFYEASSLGRIRRALPGRNTQVGRIITQRYKKGTKYLRCRVTFHNKSSDHNVHRLVCEAFHGPSKGREVDHLNNVKDDNRPENLEWVTRSENTLRTYARGYKKIVSEETRQRMVDAQKKRSPDSHARGEAIGNSSLTKTEVLSILELAKNEKSAAKIARILNIKYSRVWAVLSGKTWKHLSNQILAPPDVLDMSPKGR